MENALLVSRLNKSAGRFKILHNVTFNVPKGAVCAFIGHNGAGKTTTIKSIMGLFNFDSGLIEINGVNSKNVIISHSNIGYVPEKDNFPKIKVRRFLRDMNKLYGVDKRETDKRIDYYAKIFSLTHWLDSNLNKLSSGQKKKILIIQSLLHNANLIIMDEPTENLDPDTREIFYKIVSKLTNEGKTFFISTHNLDEIQQHINYVVIIVNGKIKRVASCKPNQNLHTIYNRFKPKILIE